MKKLCVIIGCVAAICSAEFIALNRCHAAESIVEEKIDWPQFLARHDLIWKRMPRGWSEAPFLGNGRLALCMHQEPGKNAVRFAVDRTDVFDRRDSS